MITAAIDPGKHGAVAVINDVGNIAYYDCPQSEFELIELLRGLNVSHVVLENVGGARQGNGLVSAVTFAKHCQLLRSTLTVAKIPFTLIAPSVWIPAFLGADKPQFPITPQEYQRLDIKGRNRVDAKYKTIRKKKILQKVLDKTGLTGVRLAHADAIGLLLYFKEKQT